MFVKEHGLFESILNLFGLKISSDRPILSFYNRYR